MFGRNRRHRPSYVCPGLTGQCGRTHTYAVSWREMGTTGRRRERLCLPHLSILGRMAIVQDVQVDDRAAVAVALVDDPSLWDLHRVAAELDVTPLTVSSWRDQLTEPFPAATAGGMWRAGAVRRWAQLTARMDALGIPRRRPCRHSAHRVGPLPGTPHAYDLTQGGTP